MTIVVVTSTSTVATSTSMDYFNWNGTERLICKHPL